MTSQHLLDELAPVLNRPFRVLAYGDPNVDLVFAVAQPPASDQKVLGRHLGRFAGGTVANAGCAAAALGCRTQAFGRVGADDDGRFLLEASALHGVATQYVRTMAAAQSACAMIMLEPGGEKALVYGPLPGSPFDAAALSAALSASTLVYAMPYDLEEFVSVRALARARGTLVAIDVEAAMAPHDGDGDRLMGLADIVFMNEATYRHLFGCAPALAHMRGMLARGPRILVVTRGGAGALAVTRTAGAGQDAFSATLVDSTGAGDCFNGAFLAALFEGASLQGCLRFACAAASHAVAQLGARSGIPSRARVDALLD